MELKKFGNWSVNVDGILWTGLNGTYPLIAKERLDEKGNGERSEMYDWLVHMPEKTWLTKDDVKDFNAAFCYAMIEYGYEINSDYLSKSLAEQKLILKMKG